MTEETKVTDETTGTVIETSSSGTTVTTGDEKSRSVGEYILYKLDRSLVILCVSGIAIVALLKYSGTEAAQIATAAISGLVGYLGGRASK